MKKFWNLRLTLDVSAFLLTPLLLGISVAALRLSDVLMPDPVRASAPTPTAEQIKTPDAPDAVILLSPVGTQITELLTSFEALNKNTPHTLVTLGPQVGWHPTTGGAAVWAQTDFAHPPKAPLLIIPSSLSPDHPETLEWLKSHAKDYKTILILGEGVRIPAKLGLLNGVRATTHGLAYKELSQRYSDIQWTRSTWVVHDGKWITSAGLLTSESALTLAARVALGDESRGDATANTPGAPLPRVDQDLSPSSFMRFLLWASYDWEGLKLAVPLINGVSEMALAASLDILPRSLSTKLVTVSQDAQPIVTKHGAVLLASLIATETPPVDLRLLADSKTEEALKGVSLPTSEVTRALNETSPDPVAVQALRVFSQLEGREMARSVAQILSLPGADTLDLPPPHSPQKDYLWVRILLAGIAGTLLVRLFRAKRAK